jgi:anthranilate phosphoribosyltransferase
MSKTAARVDPKVMMRSIIKRIATGPELSKDISLEEARDGMRSVLSASVDPVQAAIFLIALRMKRETDDETRGALDALREVTHTVTAAVDEVMDIADPYDGFNRSLPASPFLPAVLAENGVPALSHGVERMGPKYGVTHRQVLQEAGVNVDLSLEEAAARLADSGVGWAYVDQKAFCPKLYNLASFRSLIVKRPVITTVEVALGPLRGRRKTHLVTGYVHKPYPRIYALLARHAHFDSALIVRGVEGGVIPSLRQTGKVFYYHNQEEDQSSDVLPEEFGIHQGVRATAIPGQTTKDGEEEQPAQEFDAPAVAKLAAQAGLEALGGKAGPTRDALILGGALCLWHLRRHTNFKTAADAIRNTLDNGCALARFERGR